MVAAKGNNYALKRKVNPTYTQEQIDDIIRKLLTWANKDKGIYLAGFVYETYKKAPSWLYDLARHHKDINEALDLARELLSNKIANHCFIGDRNSAFGERLLSMYSKDYKAHKEWNAQLTQQSSESIKTTFTEMKNAIKDGSLLDMLKQEDE